MGPVKNLWLGFLWDGEPHRLRETTHAFGREMPLAPFTAFILASTSFTWALIFPAETAMTMD